MINVYIRHPTQKLIANSKKAQTPNSTTIVNATLCKCRNADMKRSKEKISPKRAANILGALSTILLLRERTLLNALAPVAKGENFPSKKLLLKKSRSSIAGNIKLPLIK